MATEKLIVKNFGPIREAELDLKKVTVFIGEQASGKSVLAKLIKIFSHIIVDEEPFWNEMEDLNLFSFFEKNTQISYQNEGHKIELRGKNRKIFNYSIEDPFLKKSTEVYLETKKTVTAIENRFNDVASQYEVYEDMYFNLKSKMGTILLNLSKTPFHSIYIPTERIILPIIASSIFSLTKNQVSIPINNRYFGI